MRFNREGVWVFFALGILSWLLALSFIVRTCKAFNQKRKRKRKRKKEEDENQEEKKTSKIAAMFDTMKMRYNHILMSMENIT